MCCFPKLLLNSDVQTVTINSANQTYMKAVIYDNFGNFVMLKLFVGMSHHLMRMAPIMPT